MNLKVEIDKIKNINKCVFELPIEKGIYCIAGANGSGKSTLLLSIAQTVYASCIKQFSEYDCSNDSKIVFQYNGKNTVWQYKQRAWKSDCMPQERIQFNGMYEGSLFYGTRFDDSIKIDSMVKEGKIPKESIVDADEYIIKKLSFILQGDYDHYTTLKRIRNRATAQKANLRNIPYFIEINGNLISQYRMSSGECLLISLLHFIYNALIRRSLPDDQPILLLIDEIELALHPVAVSRLIELLQQIIIEHDTLTVVLTSHSPEVIRKISPKNLYMMEINSDGVITPTSPCYPSYAIRDIYIHDGFDYVILVEDLLAKYVVERLLRKNNLCYSKLIHVLPIGGWENVLRFQHETYNSNTFGIGTTVFSVLDGDVTSLIKKCYKNMSKSFLPINSVEKYLKRIIKDAKFKDIKKEINDMFFTVESVDAILSDYTAEKDNNGKALYRKLLSNLEKRRISEEAFIKELCDIIIKYVDFTSFEDDLKRKLT